MSIGRRFPRWGALTSESMITTPRSRRYMEKLTHEPKRPFGFVSQARVASVIRFDAAFCHAFVRTTCRFRVHPCIRANDRRLLPPKIEPKWTATTAVRGNKSA